MREKTDRSDPEPRRETSGAGAEGETRPSYQQAWIEAYQEAQRSLVNLHTEFQRAMTESHLAFLTAMEKSLAGLRALAGEISTEGPYARPAAEREPPIEIPAPARGPVPEPPRASPRAAAYGRPETARPQGSPGKPWAVWDEPPAEVRPATAARSPRHGEEPSPAPEIEILPPAPEPRPVPVPAATVPAATVPAAPKRLDQAAEDRAEGARPARKAFGRFALETEPATRVGLAMSGLATASRVAVTDEGTGIARALVDQLQARGVAAEVVTEIPSDVSAAIFLGGLRPVGSLEDTKAVNREAFRTAKALARRLTTGRGVFVTVQDTGGDFGLSGGAGERAGLGGLAGLAKTARLEWPGATVKAIDLERGGRPAWKLAKLLAEELFDGGPELEVGLHADSRRTTLSSYQALLNLGTPHDVYSVVGASVVRQSSVIVAAGGARGITAATLVALARNARPRLALLGRTQLEKEPGWLAPIDHADDLRKAMADEARRGGVGFAAAEVDDAVRRILAAREVRANLAALHQAGSEVRYYAVDVTDREALARCLESVRGEWGPLTGVVHGAAAHSASLLADKTLDEFDLVFDTKVDGLVNLLHATSEDPLELVLLFSSVAARNGRRGQADAAMADEVLNKVASNEHLRRGGSCLVKSFNWSDWELGGRAESSPAALETAPRIPMDVGARMLVEELQAGVPDQVEVVLGLTPEGSSDPRPSSLNMLTMDVFVSAATHPFLEGYRSGGVPGLPLSMVLEWFTRITRAHCPDLEMVSCRDLKVLRSVRLSKFYEGGDAFTIVSHQRRRGSHRELHLELYGRDGSLRYTALADMARPGTMVSASDETARLIRGTRHQELRPWPFSSIYGHALFQGPECQVIRDIEGVSSDGIVAVVAGAREMGWANGWKTDVAALEGGLQLAVLWFQYKLGGAALASSVSSYLSYFSGLVEGPIRVYLKGHRKGFQRVLCDVAFVNENGTLLGELRGVEARAHIKPATVPESEVVIELEPDSLGLEPREAAEEPAAAPGEPAAALEVPAAPEEPAAAHEKPAALDVPVALEEQAVAPEEPAAPEKQTVAPEEPAAPEEQEEEAEAAPAAAEGPWESVGQAEAEEIAAGESPADGSGERTGRGGTDAASAPRAPRAFSSAWHEKASRIAATIDALLGVAQPNAQLVLCAKGLGELVRFVGGEGKLFLDLPDKYLGPERVPRAEKYFAGLGVEKEATELYEAGRLAGRYMSFGLDLGNDTGRATQIALDLFSEVYLLRDDFQLEIVES